MQKKKYQKQWLADTHTYFIILDDIEKQVFLLFTGDVNKASPKYHSN